MKISKIGLLSDKEVINIIITFHSDHFVFINNWLEFIIGKEINLPPELKNRVFCIWFSGIIDLIIDKEDQQSVLINECNKRNLKNCRDLLNELDTITDAITERVGLFSPDEQILIIHHRNTLVHARVYSIHNNKLGFLKYWDKESKMMKRFSGTKDDFWKIDRDYITSNEDNFLTPLREKFFDKNSDYYRLIAHMTNTPFFENLRAIAYKDL